MTWIQKEYDDNKVIDIKKKVHFEESFQENKQVIKDKKNNRNEILIQCFDFMVKSEEITIYMRELKKINIPNKMDKEFI